MPCHGGRNKDERHVGCRRAVPEGGVGNNLTKCDLVFRVGFVLVCSSTSLYGVEVVFSRRLAMRGLDATRAVGQGGWVCMARRGDAPSRCISGPLFSLLGRFKIGVQVGAMYALSLMHVCAHE